MTQGAPPDHPAREPRARTPLHALHVALGARMVPFAGYDMPVQYRDGILAEHQHTRTAAGLFDVSHMGQAFLVGADHAAAAQAIERLVPADIAGLAPGQQRYTQLLNENGGILDDLMITRSSDPGENGVVMLVVNASRKHDDLAHIEAQLPAGVKLMRADHRALLALQGPQAETVMTRLAPELAEMAFMTARSVDIAGILCHVSRSGYTGEDGFEISVKAGKASKLSELLLSQPEVKPIGLGARDSLRLEAGLCLYGHDIDETTTPIEARLGWSIQKRRREAKDFPGAARVLSQIESGAPRVRVGLQPEGRTPAREGARIATPDGTDVGVVTSGGFGPTVQAPIAMGYVPREHAGIGTELHLLVRGKPLPARVVAMPFAPHRYKRAGAPQ